MGCSAFTTDFKSHVATIRNSKKNYLRTKTKSISRRRADRSVDNAVEGLSIVPGGKGLSSIISKCDPFCRALHYVPIVS